MRTLMLAGAAALALAAVPSALGAQANSVQPDQPADHTDTQADAQAQPVPQSADQANAQAQPLPTTTETIPAPSPDQPGTVITTHPGNLTSPPPQAFNKTYPLCTRTLQDSCRNPGEGDGPDTGLGG